MVNASSRTRSIPGGARGTWDTGHLGKNVGLRVLSLTINHYCGMVIFCSTGGDHSPLLSCTERLTLKVPVFGKE